MDEVESANAIQAGKTIDNEPRSSDEEYWSAEESFTDEVKLVLISNNVILMNVYRLVRCLQAPLPPKFRLREMTRMRITGPMSQILTSRTTRSRPCSLTVAKTPTILQAFMQPILDLQPLHPRPCSILAPLSPWQHTR